MSTTDHPVPPTDPQIEPEWLHIRDEIFGNENLSVTAELLDIARTLGPSLEQVLDGRPYQERTIAVPGPAGDVALSIFTPDGRDASGAGLVWVHGGGMVMGDRYGITEALDLAEPSGAVVVSIEYRRAPEHPAPALVDDSYAALRWVGEHAAELGIDPARLVFGGTSGGGGIAASTALRVRDQGGPALAGVMLLCPMLDDRMATVSAQQCAAGYPWTAASNEFGWRALLGERYQTDDVTIYEVPGRAHELGGLPPTYLDVGSVDLFRDEDVDFANRIWAAGGDAELHVFPGAFHGYDINMPAAAISQDTVEVRRRWLARILGRTA